MRARLYTPFEDLPDRIVCGQKYQVLSEFTVTWKSRFANDPDEDFVLEYGDHLMISHLDPVEPLNCFFRIGDDLFWAPADDILEFCKLV